MGQFVGLVVKSEPRKGSVGKISGNKAQAPKADAKKREDQK